jgi:hypothetical protein
MSHKLHFNLVPSIAALCVVKNDDKATEAAEKRLLNTVHSALGQYEFEVVDPAKTKAKNESGKYAKLKLKDGTVKGADTRKFELGSIAVKQGTERPLNVYQFTRDSLVFNEAWGVWPSVPANLAEWCRVAAGLVEATKPENKSAETTGETVNA